MSKPTTLNINRLTNAEFIQLISRTLDSLDKKDRGYSDGLYDSLIARIKKNLPTLSSAIKSKSSNINYEDIKNATDLRNGDITALYYAIKSQKMARQKEKHQAYRTLLELINQFKNIKKGNAKAVSTLVSTLLKKLDLEPNSQAIEMLSLTELVKNLKESQTALYSLYVLRSNTESDKIDINSTEIRDSITLDYKTIYTYLQAKLYGNPEDDCKPVVKILDTIRKDFQHTIKIRTKKTENKEQDNELQPN